MFEIHGMSVPRNELYTLSVIHCQHTFLALAALIWLHLYKVSTAYLGFRYVYNQDITVTDRYRDSQSLHQPHPSMEFIDGRHLPYAIPFHSDFKADSC